MELSIERLQRWTAWAGGPWLLAAVLGAQARAVTVVALKPIVAVAAVLAIAGAVVVLARPVLEVGLLLVSRLLSTGATALVRVGRMGIGLFEPVFVLFFPVVRVVSMAKHLIAAPRGTKAEVLAWTMPAALLGYFAWSWVEFTLTEKPFWEFLALYTALYFIVVQSKSERESIGEWSTDRLRGAVQ